MRLQDFDYDLPSELIAQEPLPKRDSSRLMVLDRKTGDLQHTMFSRFPEFVHRNELLVLNNSRVIPARLYGRRNERAIEFLLVQKSGEHTWRALCRPAKHARKGDRITFSESLVADVTAELDEGERLLTFNRANLDPELARVGYAPLPPYIKRKKQTEEGRRHDLERYQTVFADKPGSIAAPTAGLHFTRDILDRIEEKGTGITEVTLHIGLATFQPVRADSINTHRMLEETCTISPGTAETINRAVEEKQAITAVGTTTVRTLESSVKNGKVEAGTRSTDLFIQPGFPFQIVNRLLTNFHLPKSTLLMLVASLAGHELIMNAYREAVSRRYRFFSYGDCMLIL
ncbi:MAG: tRNA preQ1(34) S-adenosylmethionine ribosyltransferase-isomerase QueA [Acidobacteria bacterium]|nr:tRNA preQ1(34) S-adenosylmethionine ribosyltransferase-isomerase QueA [Acidobacteriota bacterium]